VKVLLLSAYAAQSHVYWHETLITLFADWEWQVLSLPPRHFSWRVRGNPLYWALEERAVLEADYDFLIATSMVDLATLRGLVPSLAGLPSIVYFHENQFAYPAAAQGETVVTQQKSNLLEAQMVSLYSALAADRVVFNSRYNQQSFVQGCDALLNKLPDKVPAGVADLLSGKASVIPVPIQADCCAEASGSVWSNARCGSTEPALRLLWVGRFEYDKGADRLLSVLERLESSGANFELAVVGQQFRNSPAEFTDIESLFQHRLVHFGYIESRASYGCMLAGADIILSTAIHEFQGLAVLEAVAAGCVPVVPGRLAYPEILPVANCYPSYLNDIDREAEGAVALVLQLYGRILNEAEAAPDVSAFTSTALKPLYTALFEGVCESVDSPGLMSL